MVWVKLKVKLIIPNFMAKFKDKLTVDPHLGPREDIYPYPSIGKLVGLKLFDFFMVCVKLKVKLIMSNLNAGRFPLEPRCGLIIIYRLSLEASLSILPQTIKNQIF